MGDVGNAVLLLEANCQPSQLSSVAVTETQGLVGLNMYPSVGGVLPGGSTRRKYRPTNWRRK